MSKSNMISLTLFFNNYPYILEQHAQKMYSEDQKDKGLRCHVE